MQPVARHVGFTGRGVHRRDQRIVATHDRRRSRLFLCWRNDEQSVSLDLLGAVALHADEAGILCTTTFMVVGSAAQTRLTSTSCYLLWQVAPQMNDQAQ